MRPSTILHIGEDFCQRIPVMETAGFAVLRSETAITAIRTVFNGGDRFSAVIFQSDISAPPEPAVRETRSLSAAPLVLFQNPTIACNDGDFDLVIPVLTPPQIWLEKLKELIAASRELRARSQQLRGDCATIRSQSESLRARSARNRISPIDPEAQWRGDLESFPGPKGPEESRPEDGEEKAG